MSSLTICNCCSLRSIRAQHASERVIVQPHVDGGTDVFVGPRTLSEAEILADRDKYFVAWFMAVTDDCAC